MTEPVVVGVPCEFRLPGMSGAASEFVQTGQPFDYLRNNPDLHVGYLDFEGRGAFIRADSLTDLESPPSAPPRGKPVLAWHRSREEYLASIGEAQRLIRAGESYEVCLTNELRGRWEGDPLAYWLRLTAANPAPYASFLRFGETSVACCSPERFLRIDANGRMSTEPIKGTLPRGETPEEDEALRIWLATDPKFRAENLMIVDLSRHDLGRVAVPGSVVVPSFAEVRSYATVHQLVSTVEAQLRPGLVAADALESAFPPGSMTGAPKLRTLEILRRLEGRERGIYSGIIGWFKGIECDASVVIRTAVFRNGEVTIGSGGAITAQSDPEAEWDEMVLKTRALLGAF